MLENFDEAAQRCIFMARLAAITDKSSAIGTLHLLVGIYKEAPRLFHGVNWAKSKIPLIRLSPSNLHRASQVTGELPLDHKTTRALAAASEIAKKALSERVAPVHLLAGILAGEARLRKQLEKAGLAKQTRAKNAEPHRQGESQMCRSGIGYDLHRLSQNRKLTIGGIQVPFEKGSEGHSDGDVLAHAICDALLGAAGMGDIGTHFPDSDPKWRGISSLVFLRQIRQYLERRNWRIRFIDAIVVAERPKLGSYFPAMREALAKSLGIGPERINLKAKTNEGLGEIGRGEAIAAHAIATIET
jgi:2-C-methyl-D-erythritol 2,4-cyclodiphosphate synthase